MPTWKWSCVCLIRRGIFELWEGFLCLHGQHWPNLVLPNSTLNQNHLSLDKSSKQRPCRPLKPPSLGYMGPWFLWSCLRDPNVQANLRISVSYKEWRKMTYKFKQRLWESVRWWKTENVNFRPVLECSVHYFLKGFITFYFWALSTSVSSKTKKLEHERSK